MLRQSRDTTIAQRADIANAVIADLRQLESKGDDALIASTMLQAKLLAARSGQQLGAALGHDAIASLTAAQSAFVQGLGHISAAHRLLKEIPGKVGLEPMAFGDEDPCPPAIAPESAHRLRVVG